MSKETAAPSHTADTLKVGQVYYCLMNGDAVITAIEDGRIKALILETGKRVQGKPMAFIGEGKAPTAKQADIIAGWEEQWSRAKAPRVHFNPGQVVTLDKRAHNVAVKAGMDPNGKFVVIKVSDKSVNVVPLGGHGDGTSYLRMDGRLLNVAEVS